MPLRAGTVTRRVTASTPALRHCPLGLDRVARGGQRGFAPVARSTTLEQDARRSSRTERGGTPEHPGEPDDERCGSCRALAVAGAAVARPRRPRARRPVAPARAVAGRRALRRGAVVRLRPRDQRAARRRQVDRPAVLGPVRQPRRRAAHPGAARAATASRRRSTCRRSSALLYPDEQRRVVGRGPRDRHPRLDPRAQLGAALRGRARPDAARRPTRWRRSPACARSACARRRGTSARTRCAIEKEMGLAYDSLADGRRGLLRAAARRRADRRRRAAGRVGARRRGLLHDAPLPVAAALHAARATCSTSSGASSTRPTTKAASSSSPCTRTSSATARASGSSRS